MKVFISWSGDRSKYIATSLREWLDDVFQPLRPFISSVDIDKGERGMDVIASNLEDATFGIVCLTPENRKKEWILFEAGALSKVTTSPVYTYLWDLTPTDIEPPLGQFQHTKANDQDDTFALVKSINAQLPKDQRLNASQLDRVFAVWWPILEEKLKRVPELQEEEVPDDRSEASKLDEILSLVRGKRSKPRPQVESHWVISPSLNIQLHKKESLETAVELVRKLFPHFDVSPHASFSGPLLIRISSPSLAEENAKQAAKLLVDLNFKKAGIIFKWS